MKIRLTVPQFHIYPNPRLGQINGYRLEAGVVISAQPVEDTDANIIKPPMLIRIDGNRVIVQPDEYEFVKEGGEK